MVAERFGRLVEDQFIAAAGNRLAVPAAVLRAGLERPPVKPVAVLDRNRAVVLLDPPLHLLEQLLKQRLVLSRPGFEISVLGVQIGEDIRVIDLGIFRVAQPVPRVLDGDAVALIAVGAPLGGRRSGEGDRLVHDLLLTRQPPTERAKGSANQARCTGRRHDHRLL